jgi:hypothetical protein
MLDGYGARCMEAEMNVHMVPGIPGHLTRSTVSQHGRKERFHARYPFRLHERFLLDLTCGSLRSQNNTRLTLPVCKRVDPQLRGRSGSHGSGRHNLHTTRPALRGALLVDHPFVNQVGFRGDVGRLLQTQPRIFIG